MTEVLNRPPDTKRSRAGVTSRAHRRRLERWAIVMVIGLAALLRIALVDRNGLWADEIFSLAMATGHSLEHPAADADPGLGDFVEMPNALPVQFYRRYLEHEETPAGLARIIRAVRLSDTSPPLYYLLLSFWTRALGTSDAALRLFSVLWALSTLPGLVYLAGRLGGRPAVLPVCVLFAASPVALFYSTEVRMYSLVWFLAATLGALTLEVSRRGARITAFLGWILVGAAGLLTHYFFLFMWLACVTWLICDRERWRQRAPWAAILATVVIVLPWYSLVPESFARWRVTGDWLYGALGKREALSAPFGLAWSLLSGRGPWNGSRWGEWLAGLALALAVIALGRRAASLVLGRRYRLLWLLLLAACLGPVVFDLVRGTHAALIPRYALAGLPAAILLAALALGRIRPVLRFALVTLILIAWSSDVWAIVADKSRHSHPVHQIGAALSRAGNSADVVVLVHSIPSGLLSVARYVDNGVRIASWVGQLGQRRVPDSVEVLTAGYAKIMFVNIHAVGEPAPEEEWLRTHATVLTEATAQRARLVSFVPRAGERFVWDH